MNFSRRQFFVGAVSLLSFGLLSSVVNAEEKRRTRPAAGSNASGGTASGPLAQPLVDPKDPTAQALSYVEKHSEVKKPELKVERQGVAFDKQDCSNCGFYKEIGKKDGTTVGSCTLFNGKLVKAKAWCSSWNKKA